METIDIEKLKELQITLVRIDQKVAKYFNKAVLKAWGLIKEQSEIYLDARSNKTSVRNTVTLTEKGKEIAYLSIN